MEIKIKTSDFISLVNEGKIKINIEELNIIKNQINLKPKFENLMIIIKEKDVLNEIKSTLNKCQLRIQFL